MDRDELIIKQQLEIEELKSTINNYKNICDDVRGYLVRPEQWNHNAPEFPNVAMKGIVQALRSIDGI